MQEQFEIKFRLPDGTDIGPKRYPAASTVATLKETIIAQWPKGVQHFDGISQLNLNSEYINTAWEKEPDQFALMATSAQAILL